MRDQIIPKLHKWPFLLGSTLMFGLTCFIYLQSQPPMSFREILACVFCISAGVGLGVLPYLCEYRTAVRLVEANNLASVVSQIQKIERLASQISNATSQWQMVQESAGKTATAAKEIADGMAAEVKGFNEFLAQADNAERSALRLEADKARRSETEWIQVLMRVLDHIYALNQAAIRSGQPSVIEQLNAFQNACRDAARRVGLNPYAAGLNEVFDEQRHQVAGGNSKPAKGAVIGETIATGYTFQGRLLRPALVRVCQENQPDSLPGNDKGLDAAPEGDQGRLPLEKSGV